jgi:hypothetical protein
MTGVRYAYTSFARSSLVVDAKRNKAAGGGPTACYRCVARRLASSGGREPCLPCHTMERAGLSEARCVAILSGQRSPTSRAYIRDDDDQDRVVVLS